MTTPSPKPVKAWAVVNRRGEIMPDRTSSHKGHTEEMCADMNIRFGGRSDVFHVIPVLITPIGENDD